MKQLGYMARNQYGETIHIGNNPPRKFLLEHFGRSRAEKMYVDSAETGKARHCGYIIAGNWLTLFRVCAL